VRLGVQFRGTVAANGIGRWFTHSWPQDWRVAWLVVPTGPVQDRSPQIETKVQSERQAPNLLKYYLEIKNHTANPVNIEARYAVFD
jgi:hypothetical protein